MSRWRLVFALLLGAFAFQVDAGQEQPLPKDLYGDPLPANALARLGSVRWAHKNAHFAAFLPDGKMVVTAGRDATIRIWEFPTGKEQSRITLRAEPGLGNVGSTTIALNKDGKTIATQTGAGEISLHDLGNGKELTGLKWVVQAAKGGKGFPTSNPTFSPGGEHLAVLDRDGTMRIWDWVNSKQLYQYKLNANGGTFAYAPDGKSIAACDTSEAVKLVNAQTGAFLWRFKPKNNDYLMDLAFSPDGKFLAVLGEDDVYLLDPQTGKEIRKLVAGMEPENLIFSHDSTMAYITTWVPGGDRLLEVEVATGKVLRECAADYGMLSLSPDGSTLVMASANNNGPVFFNLAPGKPMAPLFSASTPFRTVQFSQDGKTLLTTRNAAQGSPSMQKWLPGTGENIGPLPVPSTLTYLAASPDGNLFAGNDRSNAGGFAAFNPSKDVNILDATSGKEIGTISLQSPEPGLSACFTPDGKSLALRQPVEGKIELYDVAGPKLMLTLPIAKPKLPVAKGKGGAFGARAASLYGAVVFSPDGKMLAALADPDTVGLWDTVTGKRIASLAPAAGQGGFAGNATFSPDSRCLAVEMNDGTAALYELSTGHLRRNFGKQQAAGKLLKGGGGYYQAATGPRFAFAPDGKAIAQAGPDSMVYLWDVLHAHEPAAFKGHAEAVAAVAFAPHSKVLASASADGTALIWNAAKVHRPTPPAQKPRAGDLESWWEALAGADAVKAFAAMSSLAAVPEQAVTWIKDHVKPVPALDEKFIQDLIAQLDHKEFNMRFRAASELLRMGEQIIPTLDKALQANLPPERKNHLEDLRSKVTPELVMQDERLREFRAVEVLEFMGTPQARQVLQTLAGGARGALLTISANAALKRM